MEKREQKRIFRFVIVCTFIFGVAAHGYCYFNLLYSHDAMIIYQDDYESLLSVGRFLAPLYLKLRGNYYPPALVGFLGLLYLGLAIYGIVRLMELRDPALLCLTCGVLVTNGVVTLTNASYLHDIDKYMLALLLAVASVWLCRRYKWGPVLAGGTLCLSMGLYQSYFQAAVFLYMMLAVKDLFDGRTLKRVLTDGFRGIGALALGLVLYAACVQGALRLSGYEMSTGYNSLANVGSVGGLRGILSLIYGAYRYVILYYFHQATRGVALAGGLSALAGVIAVALMAGIAVKRKLRGGKLALLIGLVLLMPLGINSVFFISGGLMYSLMVFSFYLAYVFVLYLLQTGLEGEGTLPGPARAGRWLKGAVVCIMAALIFNNVVFANQSYLKKHMEYQSTLFTMTRVADRMEQTEGYVPGETPVALVGDLNYSALALPRRGMSYTGAGLRFSFSPTYYEGYARYFRELLAYPVNLVDEGTASGIGKMEEVRAMPAFPAADSCQMVDGVLVVKLS